MRHRYDTRALVLGRFPHGEANAYLALLTPELGLVRARAEGVRKSGAKLASALATFSESDLVLVRGKDTWRIAGAILGERWVSRLPDGEARARAGRVGGLVLRLVAGEALDAKLFPLVRQFLEALAARPEAGDALEILAAAHILGALGLDPEPAPAPEEAFTAERVSHAQASRKEYVARINRGIAASGL